MANRRIEEQIEKLNALREATSNQAAEALRAALRDRVNLVAAKAATLAGEMQLRVLVPDLLQAFDRLFEDAVRKDPQCWGKNAIAQALKALEYGESPAYVRGAKHIQMEPVWGGQEDTAVSLRGACLLALGACTNLRRVEVLRLLVDGLADPAAPVRCDVARALAQMEGEDCALLLRLKARLGDREPSVTGQVFDCLLSLERLLALPLVGGFLKTEGGEVSEEAALSLGSSRLAGSVDLLREALGRTGERGFRQALLRAISVSRDPQGVEFLEKLLETGTPQDAVDARAALALYPDSTATNG